MRSIGLDGVRCLGPISLLELTFLDILSKFRYSLRLNQEARPLPRFDIADPDDPNTLRVPFIFVPAGDRPPLEWMREHPGWVRIPATWIPRAPREDELGEQWDVSLQIPDEPPVVPSAQADSPPRQPSGRSLVQGLGAPLRGRFPPVSVLPTPVRYDVADRAVADYLRMEAALSDPGHALGLIKTSSLPGQPAEFDSASSGEKRTVFVYTPLSSPSLDADQGPLSTHHGPAGPSSPAIDGPDLASHSDGKEYLPRQPARRELLAENKTCSQFIAQNCKASILREFPGQYLDVPVEEVFDAAKGGDSVARKARKLLMDNRFVSDS